MQGKQCTRPRGPRLTKSQKENLMNTVVECGSESRVMMPCSLCGVEKGMVPAIVVSKEEIENNPAFAEFRARLGEREGGAYRRPSKSFRRKSSNCLSSSSQDSHRNNSSVNNKRNKKVSRAGEGGRSRDQVELYCEGFCQGLHQQQSCTCQRSCRNHTGDQALSQANM